MAQGDIESLRETLALLREEGLLERVATIASGVVSFHPAQPKPVEVTPKLLEELEEKRRESLEAFERKMRLGAAGGIR